jgi:hypothetical protein
MSKQNGNVPVATIRNRSIKAAIWENHGPKGVFHTVTITRSFKQGDEWRDSHSFSHNELLIVAKLMYDAHTAISALLEKAQPPKRTASTPQLPVRGRAKE